MTVFGFLCYCAFAVLVSGQQTNYRVSPQWRTRMRQNLRTSSQNVSVNQAPVAEPSGGTGSEDDDNPQTWRDLLTRGNGVHDVTDFLSLLVTEDGRPVRESDVFSPYETQDGKRVIMGGGIMAQSDECSPRNMSVRLPLNYTNPQVAYYPECTMMQRCGGCTSSPFLSCEPLYKERLVLKVLRAVYTHPGSLSMRWAGFVSVDVERHMSCRPVCTITPQDCNARQRMIPFKCKCECRWVMPCSEHQEWDAESCRCRCRNSHSCCSASGEEDERACNSYFDHDFCECTLKVSIGASPDASQAEIDAWLISRNQSNTDNNLLPPSTTPTTTTTTPAPTPPAIDCSHLDCPRNFRPVLSSFRRCVCRFRGFRRG